MEGKIVDMNDEWYNFVRYKAVARFQMKPVRVRHLNELMQDQTLDIRHSKPGIPWEPRFKTTGEVFDSGSARYAILEFWAQARRDGKVYPPPSLVSYPNDCENVKSEFYRECQYPAVISIGELQFALPLTEGYLKDNRTPMAYAFGIETEQPWCFRSQLPPKKYYGNCTFKDFDSELKGELIKDAFFVLKENLDFSAYEGLGIPNTDHLLNQLFYIMGYFLYMPFFENDGTLNVDFIVLPSGSYFSRLVDTIIYWILVTYGYVKSYYYFPSTKQIFGDKSIEKPKLK